MKTMLTNFRILCVAFTFFASGSIWAQSDTIFKQNGEVICCKITEVGTNGISYKKAGFADGPSFVDSKDDIRYVRFSNGQKQEFPKLTAANSVNSKDNSKPEKKLSARERKEEEERREKEEKEREKEKKKAEKLAKGPISSDHKIIFDGKKYFVDGQKVGQKDVDRLLSRSTNPAVQVPLKTAKLTKTFQKITKWTSFPSTLTGGIGSIATMVTLVEQSAKGPTTVDSWVNFGLSFVGTLSFPITAKLLKKAQNKLYDKTIDLYNIDKK